MYNRDGLQDSPARGIVGHRRAAAVVKVIKTQKKKNSFLLKVAVLAFSIYMVAALVNQQIQISEKTRQLSQMQQQLEEQDIRNEELRRSLSDSTEENEDYIERYAREELDYAKPSERVFVNIAGN